MLPSEHSQYLKGVMQPAILRQREVTTLTGLSKTTLWRRVRAKDFPPALRLGGPGTRAVGWRRSDVEEWLQERQAG